MAKWKDLGELMKVELEVSLALEGGSDQISAEFRTSMPVTLGVLPREARDD